MKITSSHPQAPFARGTSAKSVPKDNVLDIIEKNFDRFDRDGNGGISWKEMRQNIADPSIKGKDAAALATLYSMTDDLQDENGLSRAPVVTSQTLEDWRDEREFAEEEKTDLYPDIYYSKYLGKLAKTSTELFPQGMPDPYQVKQGSGPSCAILATTVGQGIIDPKVIKDAVTEREDGKVAVQFPGLPKPIFVAPITDTEAALFTTAEKNGSWITHIEKAWGTNETKIKGAAFEQSSWPAKSIRAWSNGPAATTSVPKELGSYRQGQIPDFLKGASEALAQKRIVMTWSRKQPKDEGLVSFHAHTLLDIDANKGSITVRNPWGHKEPVNAKGKPRDGKDDGIFAMSFEEYATNFGRISLQTRSN